jgi:hypothetical protein
MVKRKKHGVSSKQKYKRLGKTKKRLAIKKLMLEARAAKKKK